MKKKQDKLDSKNSVAVNDENSLFLSKQVLLISFTVLLLFLSWMLLRASNWSSKKILLANFFGDSTVFTLALVAFIPCIFGILFLSRTWAFGGSIYYPRFCALYGVFFWFLSYGQTAGSRAIFSQANGFAAMPSGLADWWTIPNLIRCKNASGCDPLGRLQIYGHGWKLLFFLGNDRVALALGAMSAGYVCFSLAKFSQNIGLPTSSLLVLLSPSLYFIFDRGNSTLFIVACIFFIIKHVRKSPLATFLISALLVSLKPFFAPFMLKDRPKLIWIVVSSPIILLSYLWSMKFDFHMINISRTAILYPPNYEIGVDQIPSIFVQYFQKKFMISPSDWHGSQSFKTSMVIGLLTFLIVLILSMKLPKLNSIINMKFNYNGDYVSNIVLIFSAIYLLTYLSGSQCYYNSWISFPIVAIMLHHYFGNEAKVSISSTIIMSLVLFGGMGINIWILRSLGSFLLADVCGVFILNSYFKTKRKTGNNAT
jgi:hypothetical protein